MPVGIWRHPPQPQQRIRRVTAWRNLLYHYFTDGSYTSKNYDYNQVKVIGQDTKGNNLTGTYPAGMADRIGLRTIQMCYTQAMVNTVAENIYNGLRITQLTGGFLISHPNVGQEVLDVIRVKDDAVRIDKEYRVTGITFEMDTSKGYFQQRLELGGV
jgi:hypothetical protein